MVNHISCIGSRRQFMSNAFLSWQAILLQLTFFALVSVGLEKPVGSIAGHVSMEKPGFHLQFASLPNKKVYVLAMGLRGQGVNEERGVWVKPDGTFRIDHLPAGEYLLKANAPGYSEWMHNVFVDDGKVTELKRSIALRIVHPSVQIASNRKIFTSQETPYFWINCIGASNANIKLYRTNIIDFKNRVIAANRNPDENRPDNVGNFPVSMGNYLEFYKVYGAKQPDLFPRQEPTQNLKRKIEGKGNEWSNNQFKLNGPLPQGDYVGIAQVANAAGESDWDMFWFSVSDLGLIVKHDREKLIARAIDLNTLKPMAGVEVQLLDGSGSKNSGAMQELGQGITGNNGLVTIALPHLGNALNSSVMAIGTAAQNRAYAGIWSSGATNKSFEYKTYFYTERPVYRLGQTIYFKGIIRALASNGFQKPQPGMVVQALMEDPGNNLVWQGKFQTNDHGSFHGLFNIPEDGKTGAYQLTFTYPNGDTGYGAFEVAQYRKPEYEVTVTPLDTRVVAGKKLRARIKANYYFGAPVVNASVKYSVYATDDWASRYHLMPRPGYYSYFDDWENEEESDYSAYSGGGDFITEGTAQTDNNGEAIVEIETRKINPPSTGLFDSDYFDKRYKIEAEVTDLSRMSVVSSGSRPVTAGDFALFIESHSLVVKAGKPMPVDINVVNYEGQPVANQTVNVKLVRWIWDESKNKSCRQVFVTEGSVMTDVQGKATITLDAKGSLPSDTYFAIAQTRDSAGNLIYDQSSIWISNDNYPYLCGSDEAKSKALQVKLDKFAYKAGDVATAVITGPLTGREGADVIVAVEGTKINEFWTLPMTATARTIQIPIKSGYAPNVYLTATLVGPKHQYYNQSKIIRVSPSEHFLNLAISTDKAKYKPGGTVQYTLKATDQAGHPAANTELSLGLVDESIYAIRQETAENIQKFFFNKRPNWVETACTFEEEYSGGADKLEPVPMVRKNFKDTAVWLPELCTDAQGIAIASVALPDNLTTWRATVRGITTGTDVGSAVNKIIATQDLIVRLSLPRFFSTGDDTYINAVLHNYTGRTQPVNLTLAVSPQFAVREKLTRSITLTDKAERVSWPVKIIGSGAASVTIKAIGKTAADAMERKLNILPLGVKAFAIKAGELLKDPSSTAITIGNLTDACPGTYKHNLSLAASSIGPVLGNFDKLIDYPYGCTEQTMSRLMPSVVAMTLHKKLGLPIEQKQLDLFAKVYKRSMDKLTDYQHDDGGWGWWQTDDSKPYMTFLVLQGFYQLKQVGYAVNPEQIKKGTNWLSKACVELHKQLTDPKRVHTEDSYLDREEQTDLAAMIYTLSLYNIKSPKAAKEWLLSKVSSLAPEALCYLTLTLKQEQDKRFNNSYKALLRLAHHEADTVDWEHRKSMLKLLGVPERFFDYTYRFTDTETTALALRTVVAVDPGNVRLIEGTKKWLLLQHDANGWSNTKTTAQVFLTLLEEQIDFNKKNVTDETIRVSCNSQLIKELVFNASNRIAPEEKILLTSLEHERSINLNKSGPGRVYYNSLATYTRRLSPGENIAAKGSPEGLCLERSFYRLIPAATKSDGKIHFRSEKIVDNVIHAGDTVLMKIKVDSPVSLPYTVLEAYLPSGAEVVQDQSKEKLINNDKSDEEESESMGDWSVPWWTHQDILDDRIVFFCDELTAGKSEFSVLVRMEMPGTYRINPLSLEGMYAKNVRAYSSLDTVCVTQ